MMLARAQGAAILDHGKARGSHRMGSNPITVELGNEPPLFINGSPAGGIDRRRISVQWFSGTILTGLCGAALMGGAVFAALDGVTTFAALPERVETALRGAFNALGERSRKSDKLPMAGEGNVTRQTVRVSTTNRVGDRELVRVQPYTRIAANLSLTTSELSANIPPFNPQRLLAQSSGASTTSDAPGVDLDAEVSFVTRDLPSLLPRVKIATIVPIDSIIARVRDAANFTGSTSARYTPAGSAANGKLAYATEGTPDPYVGFEARVVPENITLLPKTANQTTGGNVGNERTIAIKKSENITTVLRDLGATSNEIKAIANILGSRGRDGGIKEGQKLRILLSPGPTQRLQPVRVIVVGESAIEAIVALSDLGKWVSVDVQSAETQVAETEDEEEDNGTGVRLYQSVYETALRHNIPRPVIDEIVRVFSYDVDFQRRVQPGDSFDVLYTDDEVISAESKNNDALFAALTIGGEMKKFYRFQTNDDGIVDFYDETGKSAKKFLVRKPLADGIMRSGFGSRKHPILGYVKMHTGIDWAAPMGTPIYASGNGAVSMVGWESGYGKYIRIKHNNGYETAYGHMTAYARGMEQGARVRQGQVIGYVGSTGLSTGAHLHYEIMVNGRFVDPMRIRLPRGRVLDNQIMAAFEKERDHIDSLLKRASSRVAQNTSANSTNR
jgi:murein DD-endopeptidase MepM/ murein hydrolase activator NlpD